MGNLPLPPGIDPDKVTWKDVPGYGRQGGYYEDDKTGGRFLPHPEDKDHWPHWDEQDANRNDIGKYPKNSGKPRSGQKKLKPNQSWDNPWNEILKSRPSLWDQFVESLGDVLQQIGREVAKWPSPFPWALPPLPGSMPSGIPILPMGH